MVNRCGSKLEVKAGSKDIKLEYNPYQSLLLNEQTAHLKI